MATQASNASKAGDTREVFRIMRSLVPRKARPPQQLKLTDGRVATAPSQVSLAWQEHFASKLCADVCSMEQLLAHNWQHQQHEFQQIIGTQLDAKHIPSLYDVQSIIARLPRNKGYGEDIIANEVLASNPPVCETPVSVVPQVLC